MVVATCNMALLLVVRCPQAAVYTVRLKHGRSRHISVCLSC
uniref:Uncharacterized protein n=1 Tax=Setaria viridis TaxID=4556 RepID=A0A4U6VGM5_SETVI|nr:hypothetical protein SEVIR_3G347750v2 [Setaria viridis]